MEISASGADAIPWILVSIIIPILVFTLIPILIIRSVLKAIKNKMPAGANFHTLRQVAKNMPKGANWQKITQEWDFKMDPVTKRITLKRKPNAPVPQGRSLPNEIQLSSFSELPQVLKQMGMSTSAITANTKSGKIESKEPPSPAPTSASSRITSTKTTSSSSIQTPKGYEIIQTIKRVAIILALVGLYYGLSGFFS
jgi:hypothetical protein